LDGNGSIGQTLSGRGDYCKNQSQSWEILDGIGYYMTYGQCENSDVTQGAKFITDGLS